MVDSPKAWRNCAMSEAASVNDRLAILQSRLSKRWTDKVAYTRPGVTRLCIDGFPRSANSMLFRKFLLSNRDAYKGRHVIAHHTHDPDSVLAAVLASIPVVMPIRRPEDCIPSALIYDQAMTRDDACRRYLAMVSLAANCPQKVLAAPFDAVVRNVNSIFAAANVKFGLALQPIAMSDEDASQAIEQRVVAAAEATHGEQWAQKVGVPSQTRALDKAALLKQLRPDPAFQRCRQGYDQMLKVQSLSP